MMAAMTQGWNTTDPQDRPSGHVIPDEFKDSRRGVRLQRMLADAGVASRRRCEELITEGHVSVNGHILNELPVWVDPDKDHITVNGRQVRPTVNYVYVMLFKPRGVVCTNSDPDRRRCAIDLIKHPSRARLYPVGRLDVESSGLLLLTNDGEMAQRLTHPKHGVHKEYEVLVEGALEEKDARRIERGIHLTGRRRRERAQRTVKSKLRILHKDRNKTRLLLELREGRNRQIRRMMARLGFRVRKLRRVRLGPLKLKDLQPGQWRDLLPDEVKALMRVSNLDHVRD